MLPTYILKAAAGLFSPDGESQEGNITRLYKENEKELLGKEQRSILRGHVQISACRAMKSHIIAPNIQYVISESR
jgi:flagellar biosynthesis/type III secretory pathway ATPase